MKTRTSNQRLEAVIDTLGKRKGAQLPTQEAFEAAQLIMEIPRACTLNASPATIYHVEVDGRRNLVALYESRGIVWDAECSCVSKRVCAHLLAALAKHGKPMTED